MRFFASSSEVIGLFGSGVFTQSGGTNSDGNGLIVAEVPGSAGTYNLGGSGWLNAVNYEYVGYMGSGSFTQTSGTNTTGTLSLSASPDSFGLYNLSGGLLLASTNELITTGGTGIFTQTGGTNSTGSLGMAYFSSFGVYNLSGGLVLASSAEVIAEGGRGSFTQTGGTNSTGTLTLTQTTGSNGAYNLAAVCCSSAAAESRKVPAAPRSISAAARSAPSPLGPPRSA